MKKVIATLMITVADDKQLLCLRLSPFFTLFSEGQLTQQGEGSELSTLPNEVWLIENSHLQCIK